MIRVSLFKVTAALATILVMGFFVGNSARAGDRLMADFTPGKCLDIVNDGQNNKLTMADCGKYSGQNWTAAPSGAPGTFKLRNGFSGANKCLDVINDGQNNKLIMADCGNYSGQNWSIPRAGQSGSFKNQFTGTRKCLDIINDGKNNRVTMANCGNYSGQRWTPAAF